MVPRISGTMTVHVGVNELPEGVMANTLLFQAMNYKAYREYK